MKITNEEAMQQLQANKDKADADGGAFLEGILLGACGAYYQAGVITYDQFKQLTHKQAAV